MHVAVVGWSIEARRWRAGRELIVMLSLIVWLASPAPRYGCESVRRSLSQRKGAAAFPLMTVKCGGPPLRIQNLQSSPHGRSSIPSSFPHDPHTLLWRLSEACSRFRYRHHIQRCRIRISGPWPSPGDHFGDQVSLCSALLYKNGHKLESGTLEIQTLGR